MLDSKVRLWGQLLLPASCVSLIFETGGREPFLFPLHHLC